MKLLSLLFHCMLAYCIQAYSQQTANGTKPVPDISLTTGKATATQASRLVAEAYRSYGFVNYILEDTTTNMYDPAGRRGLNAIYKEWMYDTSVTEDGSGTPYRRFSNVFSAVVSHKATNYMDMWQNGQWSNKSRIQYQYNSAGYRTQILTAQFNINKWDTLRDSYSYNSQNLVTEYIREQYDAVNMQWKKSMRHVYTYNSSNNVETYLVLVWNNSLAKWDSLSRLTYTYTGQKETSRFRESYSGGQWTPGFKTMSTYDANGFPAATELQSWDAMNMVWKKSTNDIYTYDASGRLLETVYQVVVGSNYENSYHAVYTYNSYDQVLTATYESWDPSTQQYEVQQGDDLFYYYYEIYTVGINDIKPADNELSVYPVPAGDRIFVRGAGANSFITITDMNGREVYSGNTAAGAGTATRIDVSGIPVGNYVISTISNGQAVAKSISIVR